MTSLDTDSMARVHTFWSWAHRLAVVQTEAAMAKLTDDELADCATTADLATGWVQVEQMRRRSEHLGGAS